MTQTPQLPDPEKVKQRAANMHEISIQFDAQTLILDELSAQVADENRRSRLYVYRLEKAKRLLNSLKLEKGGQNSSRGGEVTNKCMANLPDEAVTTVFNLQRRLWELINQATTAAWVIFEQFGETEETLPELEELRNAAERLRNFYSRLYTLMLQVVESQPSATSATLNLLA